MSIRLYEYMKAKYEDTKPIRGRAIDTRPWDDRRRDAELIVRITRALDGAVTYGAQLYGTTVFSVDPSGMLSLRCDSWVTPTTSKFLDLVLRTLGVGRGFQRFNSLWVSLRPDTTGSDNYKFVRIPRSGTVDIPYNPETNTYIPPEQYVTKRSTDTIKMKELRAKAKGFVKYYRSLLKLSDGLVTAQFKADNTVVKENTYHINTAYVSLVLDGYDEPQKVPIDRYFRMKSSGNHVHDALFHAMIEGNEESYAPMLTWFASVANAVSDSQFEQVTYNDGTKGKEITCAVNVQQIDRMVTQILKEVGDAYTYTEVKVTEPMRDDSDRA
jgi:hypothetical protein